MLQSDEMQSMKAAAERNAAQVQQLKDSQNRVQLLEQQLGEFNKCS